MVYFVINKNPLVLSPQHSTPKRLFKSLLLNYYIAYLIFYLNLYILIPSLSSWVRVCVSPYYLFQTSFGDAVCTATLRLNFFNPIGSGWTQTCVTLILRVRRVSATQRARPPTPLFYDLYFYDVIIYFLIFNVRFFYFRRHITLIFWTMLLIFLYIIIFLFCFI